MANLWGGRFVVRPSGFVQSPCQGEKIREYGWLGGGKAMKLLIQVRP